MLTLIQGTARLTVTDRPMRAEAWLFGDRTGTVGPAILQANSLVIIGVTAVTALLLYLWFALSILLVEHNVPLRTLLGPARIGATCGRGRLWIQRRS